MSRVPTVFIKLFLKIKNCTFYKSLKVLTKFLKTLKYILNIFFRAKKYSLNKVKSLVNIFINLVEIRISIYIY